MNADGLDPERFESIRDNRGVPIPVPLGVRHEGNLANAVKYISQDAHRVLQISTAPQVRNHSTGALTARHSVSTR